MSGQPQSSVFKVDLRTSISKVSRNNRNMRKTNCLYLHSRMYIRMPKSPRGLSLIADAIHRIGAMPCARQTLTRTDPIVVFVPSSGRPGRRASREHLLKRMRRKGGKVQENMAYAQIYARPDRRPCWRVGQY